MLLVLLVATSCKSYGPRFDARRPISDLYSDSKPHFPKPARLDESKFASIDAPNPIHPEWLSAPTNAFRLGPGDIIDIETLGAASSHWQSLVGPDGKIYYNVLKGLPVAGLTLSETKQSLESALSKELRVVPDLTINLKTVGSKHVWILGTVTTPGLYPLGTPMSLLEAISVAGGIVPVPNSPSGMADLRNSFVMRQGSIVRVDFQRLLARGDLSQNIYLQPDDFVYVRSSQSRDIYVLGAVAAPNVLPFAEGVTLLSALSAAGGTAQYAKISEVAIVRGSLSSPRVAMVNFRDIYKGAQPDVQLQEGDIVFVPYVGYRKIAMLLESMLDQFVRTVAVNEGSRASLPNFRPSGAVQSLGGVPIQ